MRDFIAERKTAERAYFDMEPTGLSVIKARRDVLSATVQADIKQFEDQLMAGEDMQVVNRGSW